MQYITQVPVAQVSQNGTGPIGSAPTTQTTERITPWPNLEVLGVRQRHHTELVLRDTLAGGKFVLLDLAASNTIAARLAPYIGGRQDPKFLASECRELAKAAIDLDSLKTLSDGIHVLEDRCVVMVSGGRTFTLDGDSSQFREEAVPILSSAYLAEAHFADWLEFTVDDLNAAPTYTPYQAWCHLLGILEAWQFGHDADRLVHALLIFHLPIHSLWVLKPLVEVQGYSGSGKSRLLQGLYGRGVFPRIGGPFIPTTLGVTDTTEAGAFAALAGSTIPLVIDEGETGDNPRLAAVVRALRASASGGATRLRSTREGKARSDHLNVPVILASIQGASLEDADIRRWIQTPLIRDDSWPDPEKIVSAYLASEGVDARELRRSILIASLRSVSRVLAAYRALQVSPPPSIQQLDHRVGNILLQLGAVASAIGLGGGAVASYIGTVSRDRAAQAQSYTAPQSLLQTLLHASFDHVSGFTNGGAPRRVPTTVAKLLEEMEVGEVQLIDEAGCRLERPGSAVGLVFVKWEAVIKGPLLRTPFERRSPRTLAGLASQLSEFEGNSVVKLYHGRQVRTTALRITLE